MLKINQQKNEISVVFNRILNNELKGYKLYTIFTVCEEGEKVVSANVVISTPENHAFHGIILSPLIDPTEFKKSKGWSVVNCFGCNFEAWLLNLL